MDWNVFPKKIQWRELALKFPPDIFRERVTNISSGHSYFRIVKVSSIISIFTYLTKAKKRKIYEFYIKKKWNSVNLSVECQ